MSLTLKQIVEISQNYNTLLFDMDGTLINSINVYKDAWLYSVENHGVKVNLKKLKTLAGASNITIANNLITSYNLDTTVEEILRRNDEYLDKHLLKETTLMELSELLIDNYGKKKIGLGTGSNRKAAHKMLSHFDILKYFGAIVTSDDVLNEKPNPETWLTLVKILNSKPEDCVVFEDGDFGIAGALKVGINAIDIVHGIFYDNIETHKKHCLDNGLGFLYE